MTLEADLIVDRAKLKRRLTRWRIFAVLALAAAVGLAAGADRYTFSRPHVARLAITGVITDDRDAIEALRKLRDDGAARALIVAIDSPGGTVSGGESLHAAIARVAEQKPVVAVMGATAASAGYMVALPANRVFAREGTLTGSIGVVLQTFEASRLMERIGVGAEALTSGALKDQPSPFRPLTEEGRAALNAIIGDLHAQFVRKVAEGRRMDEAAVRALADGRAMTGRQALAAGLIDAIGGEAEARAWLASEKSISESLPIRTLADPDSVRGLLSGALAAAHRAVLTEWLRLDLPMAVWQPR
jgi:protease-4